MTEKLALKLQLIEKAVDVLGMQKESAELSLASDLHAKVDVLIKMDIETRVQAALSFRKAQAEVLITKLAEVSLEV